MISKTSQLAIERSGIAPSRITHVVTVSCTGFVAPGLDHALIQAHELRETFQRVPVGFMGCHAMVNGLRVAQAICQADGDAVALVSSVELCSIHQQYSED
ncbi:MAG: type III polyketide synthase, partial [Pirellula sp.]